MRFLYLDDDQLLLRSVKRELQRGCVTIAVVSNPSEAMTLLAARGDVGVVVSDYDMPGMDGVTFLGAVAQRWPRVRRLLLTGSPRDGKIGQAIESGVVQEIVSKSEPASELFAALQRPPSRPRRPY